MSRTYFVTKDAEAAVRGPDRALLASFVDKFFVAMVGVDQYTSDDDGIWAIIDPPIPERPDISGNPRARDLMMRLGYSGFSNRITFRIDGHSIPAWYLSLNTAIAAGGPPLQFAARFHAQCEMHAWVDGPNRKWLAGIIRQGRALGMYRPNLGWESVIDLLEGPSRGPVVLSSSFTEGFPSRDLAKGYEYSGDVPPDKDRWYKLSDTQRWRLAMKGLRESNDGLEMHPDTWDDFWFGETDRRYTAFDVVRAAAEVHENRPDSKYGRIWTTESGTSDEPLSSSDKPLTSAPSASS